MQQPALEAVPETRTILVIEDDAEVRLSLQWLLEDAGFAPVLAENGVVGLQLAAMIRPRVIISDYVMPDVDGLEVLRTIRHNPETAHIPFILLTANYSTTLQEDARDAGASVLLTKPFLMDNLVETIRFCLARDTRGPEEPPSAPFAA